jgi:hypothetical protein
MEAAVQNIFLLGYAGHERRRRLPEYIRKAVHCIMVCRTAVLGGHTQGCPDGHYKRHWYNSCKHRMCPMCAYTQIERWLAKQKARILNTDHFHLIFTISDKLHFLWQLNQEVMTSILFKCATETLFQLLKDPKYLGAKVGIIASLHTWTKTLGLHPHLHCLVTAGGLHANTWVSTSRSYLLPFRVVRKKFRGKFIAHIRESLDQDLLILPSGMSPQQMHNLLNKLGRMKWNVHLKETYSYGDGVLTYLARYLRGGPISNSRILSIKEGKVVFNRGREKIEPMTLSIDEFIERYLQHVPKPESIRVRSYGIYHHSCKGDLDQCRNLLGQPPVEGLGFLDWQTICGNRGERHPEICPVCGKRLVTLEVLRPVKAISAYSGNEVPDISYAKAA